MQAESCQLNNIYCKNGSPSPEVTFTLKEHNRAFDGQKFTRGSSTLFFIRAPHQKLQELTSAGHLATLK
jgi:hypothetical protein